MKTKSLIFSVYALFILIVFSSFTLLSPTLKVLDTVDNKGKFEGEIAFTKKVGNNESQYKYLVKDDLVRIEELDKEGKIKGVMLVNTSKNSVTALNPIRKMYMKVDNSKNATIPEVELSKSETSKLLNGYNCKEWTATSKEQDRVITYWLAVDNFHFMVPLLKTLNRRDKQAVFFLAMSGTEGAFPMLSIEKKTDGTEISRLTVTSISKKTIDASLFEIPKEYTSSDK